MSKVVSGKKGKEEQADPDWKFVARFRNLSLLALIIVFIANQIKIKFYETPDDESFEHPCVTKACEHAYHYSFARRAQAYQVCSDFGEYTCKMEETGFESFLQETRALALANFARLFQRRVVREPVFMGEFAVRKLYQKCIDATTSAVLPRDHFSHYNTHNRGAYQTYMEKKFRAAVIAKMLLDSCYGTPSIIVYQGGEVRSKSTNSSMNDEQSSQALVIGKTLRDIFIGDSKRHQFQSDVQNEMLPQIRNFLQESTGELISVKIAKAVMRLDKRIYDLITRSAHKGHFLHKQKFDTRETIKAIAPESVFRHIAADLTRFDSLGGEHKTDIHDYLTIKLIIAILLKTNFRILLLHCFLISMSPVLELEYHKNRLRGTTGVAELAQRICYRFMSEPPFTRIWHHVHQRLLQTQSPGSDSFKRIFRHINATFHKTVKDFTWSTSTMLSIVDSLFIEREKYLDQIRQDNQEFSATIEEAAGVFREVENVDEFFSAYEILRKHTALTAELRASYDYRRICWGEELLHRWFIPNVILPCNMPSYMEPPIYYRTSEDYISVSTIGSIIAFKLSSALIYKGLSEKVLQDQLSCFQGLVGRYVKSINTNLTHVTPRWAFAMVLAAHVTLKAAFPSSRTVKTGTLNRVYRFFFIRMCNILCVGLNAGMSYRLRSLTFQEMEFDTAASRDLCDFVTYSNDIFRNAFNCTHLKMGGCSIDKD